jgi:hypothetical protein
VQLFESARQRCIVQFRWIYDRSHPGSMGKLVALFKPRSVARDRNWSFSH